MKKTEVDYKILEDQYAGDFSNWFSIILTMGGMSKEAYQQRQSSGALRPSTDFSKP